MGVDSDMARKEYSDLCAELHGRTQKIHDESNRLTNLKLLIALTDSKLYGQVLKDFYHVFKAIEDGLEVYQCADEKYVLPLRNPRWYRSAQLAQDVEFFLGAEWQKAYPPSAAAVKYLDRVAYVMDKEPVLIFAHAQTQFMAALAGGQILKKIVSRTLGLKGPDGLAFFEFPGDNAVSVRSHIKGNVNAMEMEADMVDRMIKEKEIVFALNDGIAAEVTLSIWSFRRLAWLGLLGVVGCYGLTLLYKMASGYLKSEPSAI